MRTPKDQLPSVALRMRAGQMLVDGQTPDSVARELGISTTTARRYRTIIEDGGLNALASLSVGGRKPILDAKALEWIANSLRGSPLAFGFESDQWTDGRLQSVIGRRFGVQFSRVYVRQIVINLGLAERLKARVGNADPSTSPVLIPTTLSWIAAALNHSPRVEGFDADRWTNERLRTAIAKRVGVQYSRTYVWKIVTDLGLAHLVSKSKK